MAVSPERISAIIPTRGDCDIEPIRKHLSQYFKDIRFIVGNDVYSRYQEAVKADYSVIYTQDDDCIVNNIKELIKGFTGRLICNTKEHHFNYYKNLCGNRIALVGWGAIFNRKSIDFSQYLDKYPDDRLFRMECDRVFTWLNDKEQILGDITDIEREKKMSLEDNHYKDLTTILNRLKNL